MTFVTKHGEKDSVSSSFPYLEQTCSALEPRNQLQNPSFIKYCRYRSWDRTKWQLILWSRYLHNKVACNIELLQFDILDYWCS